MARPPALPDRPTPADRKEVWLELIRDGVGIMKAAEQVGIDKRTTLDWRRDDDEFNERFQTAYAEGRTVAFDLGRERVQAEVLTRLAEGAVQETFEPNDSGELVLTKRVVARSPADVANALRAYGLDKQTVEHSGGMEVSTPDVAAAIERFTTLVSRAIREASGERAGDLPQLTE